MTMRKADTTLTPIPWHFRLENEDGINDYVEPSLYYLRNYKKSEYQIVDKDGKVVKNLGTDYDGVKDYYSASSVNGRLIMKASGTEP